MFQFVKFLVTVMILVATASGCATAARAGSSVAVPSDALVISGVIGRGNIIPIGKELLTRADRGDEKVTLIINSPGGEIITGFLFLNMMQDAQARGLKVVCLIPQIAASMAFQIALHCDERHVLRHSFLLWHRARVAIGGMFAQPLTGPEATRIGKDLETTDRTIFSQITRFLGEEVSQEELMRHFEAETLHTGLGLHTIAPKAFTVHDAFPGVYRALEAAASQSQAGELMRAGELIYISDRFR